jgi:hypothetical protein
MSSIESYELGELFLNYMGTVCTSTFEELSKARPSLNFGKHSDDDLAAALQEKGQVVTVREARLLLQRIDATLQNPDSKLARESLEGQKKCLLDLYGKLCPTG